MDPTSPHPPPWSRSALLRVHSVFSLTFLPNCSRPAPDLDHGGFWGDVGKTAPQIDNVLLSITKGSGAARRSTEHHEDLGGPVLQ